MDDRKGERFGRYEILSELGRGAMGVVYKARDPKINRVVAVKTFNLEGQPPEEEQEYRERFFRESEAAGRLSHPGIVTIFDVGEEPETRAPYIVMEFVGGQSLDKVLSEHDNKLTLETALQLAHELSEALDCAHGQGVVHRDLKPANILITEEGHAKIADFGVAKLNLATQTLGGRALGTPAYMSPEQLNGDAVDGRSDLFSLGVVLYTVLTGYRPFQGNSAMTVSFKVVNRDPVPATVLDTQLPLGVDYIIARAMAKDPTQRYQRGMEMALDIQDLTAGRELWSKAKQPGSLAGAAALPSNAKARYSAVGKPLAAGSRSGHPDWQVSRMSETLIDKLRMSFATFLILVGLMVLGLRVVPLVWTKASPAGKQNAIRTTSPLAGEAATPSASSVPAQASAPAAKKGVRGGGKTSSSAQPGSATLEIEIEHKFPEAHLSIWVDSRLSYTHELEPGDKKHLVVFHSAENREFHAMQIPPGRHQLRVSVTSGQNSADHSSTVSGSFARAEEKMLHVRFDKHGEMSLSLD